MIKISIPTVFDNSVLTFNEIKNRPGIYRPVTYNNEPLSVNAPQFNSRLIIQQTFQPIIFINSLMIMHVHSQHDWHKYSFETMKEEIKFVPEIRRNEN